MVVTSIGGLDYDGVPLMMKLTVYLVPQTQIVKPLVRILCSFDTTPAVPKTRVYLSSDYKIACGIIRDMAAFI